MSDISGLKDKLQKQLAEIDIKGLTEKSITVGYFHDRAVPVLNEIMTSSASEAKNYEDAYRNVVTKIRSAIESIALEKRNTDINLMTSVGKKSALESVIQDLDKILDEEKSLVQKQRVDTIAEKIQSGSYDPDVPRKIGTRPEKIKDIRAAKATLFGANTSKDSQ